MAEAKAAKKPARRKKRPEGAPRSRGVAPDALGSGSPPAAVTRLAEAIEADGGTVLASYRDPLGGHWQIFAGLPIDLVEPTPYQRDLSDAHVAKLCSAIDRLGRFLDPMVVVRTDGRPLLDPQRQPSPRRHADPRRPRRRRHRGARGRGGPPDPAAQHREGAQPPGARARGGPAGGGAGRRWTTGPSASSRPSSRSRRSSRWGSATWRTAASPAAPTTRCSGGSTSSSARALPKALEIRRERAAKVLELEEAVGEAIKRPQGARVRESLPPRVRGRPDQPAPLPARRQGRFRRDHREDARVGAPVRRRPEDPGRTRWRGAGPAERRPG